MDKKFNLEHQFSLYLKRVGLKKENISAIQYTEMKRAFIGACGQFMILLRDDLGALPEDEAIKTLDDMMNQVSNFFIKQSNRMN